MKVPHAIKEESWIVIISGIMEMHLFLVEVAAR
jgi:hypothetical protein